MNEGKFFLDTNVFAYTFDPNAPAKAKRSEDLIRTAVVDATGVISYQVVQEFFNVAFRRFPVAMTGDEATKYLIAVFGQLVVIQSSEALYAEALRLYGRYRLAWYDSLIVAAALEGGCSTLYSEDFQHGSIIEGLRIENPYV
jgi:predicted nucleic acid-binding protein